MGTWVYNWDFGDSTQSSLIEPLTHQYSEFGNYDITLIVHSAHCYDTAQNSIQIVAPAPVAAYNFSGFGCAPLTVQFNNQSLYATSYLWTFGDGNFSTHANPLYTYYNAGDFQVQLTASGPGGQDNEGSGMVHVYQNPTAYFSVAPTVVFLPNQPVHCFNSSENAISYIWSFGDGTTSNEENPIHNYTTEGEFTITLIASTIHQCKDTFSLFRAVVAKSAGQIDFPSAFSPNPLGSNGGAYNPGDYNNDVFHPVFLGVDQYELTIYNRWGELIFETKEPNIGWDGYYRGELCKQDVYVWKAKGKFINGESFFKAGDVTLIR
jgi:gliding motility-associated-like protein